MRKPKAKSASQNKRHNESIARGEVREDREALIAALKNALLREGLMPAKEARIKERLKKLGVTA